jgi:two-component system, OmpR family, sensor kinase
VIVAAGRFRRFLASTRGRFTLAWVAIFAIALAVIDVGVHIAVAYTTNAAVDAELRGQAAVVGTDLRPADDRLTYPGGDLPHETAGGLLIDLAVVGPGGVLLATPDQPLDRRTLGTLAAPVFRSGRPSMADFSDAQEVRRRAYATPVTSMPDRSAVLVAMMALTDVDAAIARATLIAALLSALALAASTALVYTLIGRVLSPVSHIARLAESLGESDLHRRVEVRAPDDEVGELVATFNRMLTRLEASFQALRSFTADASHELRSPLAVMATELEYGLGRRRSAADTGRAMRVLQDEVRHMSEMVEKLLTLARLDAGELRPARERLDVTDFVQEAAARWLATADAKAVRVEVDTPESGTVVADPALTRRILDNLLDNAIRHSPPGGRVRVSTSIGEDAWLLSVSDEGPGVPRDQRSRVFERFARADTVRGRVAEEGAGLGLSLSAAFARVQGGDVRLTEAAGTGAEFTVRLPNRGPDDEP